MSVFAPAAASRSRSLESADAADDDVPAGSAAADALTPGCDAAALFVAAMSGEVCGRGRVSTGDWLRDAEGALAPDGNVSELNEDAAWRSPGACQVHASAAA